MNNKPPPKIEPGNGTLFFVPEHERRSDRAPPYQGYMIVDRDYKRGQKIKMGGWIRDTSRGTQLVALREDVGYKDWVESRKEEREQQKDAPHEIKRGYARENPKPRYNDIDDDSVPF